jgi:hypothetical protein
MKRARPDLTMEQRRQRKQAMSGTERSRRSRERKREREAAESTTKQERFRDEAKVHMQHQAIREGVDVADLNRCFRDREGRLHDLREILFADVYPEQPSLIVYGGFSGSIPSSASRASVASRSPAVIAMWP